MANEPFTAVVDLAAVDEWRLRWPETEGPDGRSGEADIGKYVCVVGLLHAVRGCGGKGYGSECIRCSS